MELTRGQFEVLAYIEEHGKKEYIWRDMADDTGISGSAVNEGLDFAKKNGLIAEDEKTLEITEKGLEALEPYRVERAVFFVAGFGSRMVPVTLDTPKPMVKVNGVRIIDRMIDAMLAKGINDITLVRGYLKDEFEVLREKYPFINMLDNDRYEKENNISSALIAGDKVDNCYICAGDLLLTNPDVIKKYHYCSDYLASYAIETDDWCFDNNKGYACNYRKGGDHAYNQYEIAYWNKADSARLREDWKRAYKTEGGYDLFWEFIPLVLYKDDYKVEIRECSKKDVMEIDNFFELVEIDPSYKDYKAKK